MPDSGLIKARIDEIEAEMKTAGMWSESPLPPEAYDFHKAFAMDTMAYSQWLQFVFVPRVNDLITSGGQFPSSKHGRARRLSENSMATSGLPDL